MTLVPRFDPRLMPETTRSGGTSRRARTAILTQSAGVPLVAKPTTSSPRRNSWMRSGMVVVMAWPTAERSASGATTITRPRRFSSAERAWRPGEVMPSSLVTRMSAVVPSSPEARRPGSVGHPEDDLAELVGMVEPLQRRPDLVQRVGRVHHRPQPPRHRPQHRLELPGRAHGGAEQVGLAEEQPGHVDLGPDPGGGAAEHDPAALADGAGRLLERRRAHVLPPRRRRPRWRRARAPRTRWS